jgi:hypothetical protein
VCALWDPIFLARPRFFRPLRSGNRERYEVTLPAIDGEQVRHHLPSYGQGRSMGVSFLFLSFIDQGQVMILSGRQLRGFHQYSLDMFVALF